MGRAFGRRDNQGLIEDYRRKFYAGAKARGVDETAAATIFKKFNGLYMFPESHAFAFGVTAYQASWLKYYYPLEFFVAIFNQQPMGFYNLETLKEDARRHGITVLNPDINKSRAVCIIENQHSSFHAPLPRAGQNLLAIVSSPLMGEGQGECKTHENRKYQQVSSSLRLGFLNVLGLGGAAAKAIEKGQSEGTFRSIGDFLERTGVLEDVALNLADAGAFDTLESNRRQVKWEIGLRYRPVNSQLFLLLPVAQDMVKLEPPDSWQMMKEEYNVLSLFPAGHIMSRLRSGFSSDVYCSTDIECLPDGTAVTTAGLVIRRQRPMGKAVFITLEDEFGHIPLLVFEKVYERYEHKFKSPFLIVKGRFIRREGTHNVVVDRVQPFTAALDKIPVSKDFR